MVTCFMCGDSIPTFTGLKLHLKLHHTNVTSYKCVEEGCNRTFQLFFSFKRHFKKEHQLNLPNHSQNYPGDIDSYVHGPVPSEANEEPAILCPDPAEPCHVTHDLSDDITKSLSTFVASLYADPILPRSNVGVVVSGVQTFVSDALVPAIKNCVGEAASKCDMSQETVNELVNNLTNLVISPFNTFNSERNRLNYFEEVGSYIPPKKILIGQRFDFKKTAGVNRMESIPCEEQFIPLRDVLKNYFSMENVLDETLRYIDSISDDANLIENFVQGSFWKSKKAFHNGRRVLPLHVYFDDYETGNVLGSHAGIHKLGAVYVSVACLPPQRVSALSNIFLALLFHSSDRVKFGNNIIFKPLIDELNFLSETGISVNTPSFEGKLYFEIGLILGDNLGLHSITGFGESFSSKFPCRICKVEKTALHKQIYEDAQLLRNAANYETDLVQNNQSLTGIKEKCVWLNVKDFDLFQQVGVDIMHDILEGVSKYILSFIIVSFIETYHFFTLETLNERISTFPYGPDLRNKPCVLEMNHLKADNVRLSASEMLTLLRFFGLLVGEFVPRNHSIWSLYITLRKILDVVFSPCISIDSEGYLKTLVGELNEKYISLTKTNLKPKFHHLVHYPALLPRLGPLINIWSMRFEAKHRPSKLSAKASCNRRNITLTLAKKHQLQLNDLFCRGRLDNTVKVGPICPMSDLEKSEVKSHLGLDETKTLDRVKWVEVSSMCYEKGTVIADSLEEKEGYLVRFVVVNKVYVHDCKMVIISGSRLKTVCFDEHFYAYEVEYPDFEEHALILQSKLLSHIPNAKPFNIFGKSYIVLRGPV